jgi:hypothetical protein
MAMNEPVGNERISDVVGASPMAANPGLHYKDLSREKQAAQAPAPRFLNSFTPEGLLRKRERIGRPYHYASANLETPMLTRDHQVLVLQQLAATAAGSRPMIEHASVPPVPNASMSGRPKLILHKAPERASNDRTNALKLGELLNPGSPNSPRVDTHW